MEYRTEDGQTVETGARAFDYYNMKPGTIGRDGYDGWFDFAHDDGTITTLNGERLCSVAFAVGRGWMPAESVNLLDA